MGQYVYSKLKDPHRDIRLVEVLPGSFNDDIRLRIYHAALDAPVKQPNQQHLTAEELSHTLPPGWRAFTTYEGRYLFCCTQEDNDTTTWEHPDPKFAHLTHATPPQGTDQQTLEFEALSYVWGSAQTSEDALVECPHQSQGFASLPLGQNLALALRHLRYEKTTRTLWVDAICINQSDIAEREAQVMRMADVYSLASRVVIWLGPDSESTGEAIDTLRHLGEQVEVTVDRWRIPTPEATEPRWYSISHDLPYSPETCDAIVELLRRDWFKRVWVLQEAKLANPWATMQCGSHHISWALFRRAVMCLWEKERLPSQDLRDAVSYVASMMFIDHTVYPISGTLLTYASRKATDMRDKVYGLLGLFSTAFRQRINPQYSASIAEVYTNMCVAHIEHTKRLELLRYCGLDLQRIQCPSWVQDLSGEHPMRRHLNNQLASLNSACHAHFQAPDKLAVLGVTVTSLRYIRPENRMPGLNSSSTKTSYEEILSAVRKAEPANLNEEAYMTGETFREAYSRTLVANQLRSRIPEDYSLVDADTWRHQRSKNALFGNHAVVGTSDAATLSYTERFALEKLSGRVLVESEEGHVGLCPGGVQQGKST